MRVRNPDPHGDPQEMVIPDDPATVDRMLGQGWVQVSAPLVHVTHPERGQALVNGDEIDTYRAAGYTLVEGG